MLAANAALSGVERAIAVYAQISGATRAKLSFLQAESLYEKLQTSLRESSPGSSCAELCATRIGSRWRNETKFVMRIDQGRLLFELYPNMREEPMYRLARAGQLEYARRINEELP